MNTKIALTHTTQYDYDKPVRLSDQILRLKPMLHTKNILHGYDLQIFPKRHKLYWLEDPLGNAIANLYFKEYLQTFIIQNHLVVELVPTNPFDFVLHQYALNVPFEYASNLASVLSPYLTPVESVEAFQSWLNTNCGNREDTVEFIVSLNQKIAQDFVYEARFEQGVQSVSETLRLQKGSCRDLSYFLMQALRFFGLASRFVSGYLVELENSIESQVAYHAWVEVYLPGAGWVGLDPSSGFLTTQSHIPLAAAPHPDEVMAISGSHDPAKCTLSYRFEIEKIEELKQKKTIETKSFSKWIKKLEHDNEVKEIFYTIGSEPTFTYPANQDAPEWNITAVSQEKKKLGIELVNALSEKFTQPYFTVLLEEKWYANEPTPRFALNAYYRKDGHKILNQNLPFLPLEKTNVGSPKALISEIAQLLNIDSQFILNAFVALEADKKKSVGCILPLQFSVLQNQWISNLWYAQDKTVVLLKNQTPFHKQLPIETLPSPEGAQADSFPPLDYLEQENSLPEYEWFVEQLAKGADSRKKFQITDSQPAGWVKTALCVFLTQDGLVVALPRIRQLTHYLELLVCIEQAADTLGVKILLSGYPPPQDLRLVQWSVTPDPGVLEVNLPPVEKPTKLVEQIHTLFKATEKIGLSAVKYDYNGQPSYTGGGHHITLGAQLPQQSPFLNNPKILQNMLLYWQKHPALSYLFSGKFIGPTSQAPRIDEARHETLYELEIAFRRLAQQSVISPWLIDRIFRNLLVDLSGNTHRSEFCIDKLYSQENANGRQGLLELRAFEMPSHPERVLLQSFLVQTLLCYLWDETLNPKFKRFGTQLHDKFMLPFFIWEDFKKVIRDLNKAYPISLYWFEGFYENRFPVLGILEYQNLKITLRKALEPWHVLGEDITLKGVSRYVDASAARLEVLVENLDVQRYVLSCNQIKLPLHSLGNNRFICAVRYKTQFQSVAIHPTVPMHNPLVFDIIDKDTQCAVSGCRYYETAPNKKPYQTLPMNEKEAASRCRERFVLGSLTGGKIVLKEPEFDLEFPYTLDLRKY